MKQLNYQEYYDRVLGGWIGKFIGGTIGGPLEGVKTVGNLNFYPELPQQVAAINDDNDFQLVWLHALQEKGITLSSEDLMKEWLEHIPFPWCEYGYAVKNFRMKIKPPVSGWFNNDYFKECMGCPVRSEIWGFISPGNPELATDYARRDGVLDHVGNSVWAEMFLAAMDSMAFFESDPRRLIEIGLEFIPVDSHLSECIRNVIGWYEKKEHWLYIRQLLLDRYGSPDMTSALQNLGITVLALLYGEGDFEKTMLTAVNCGYDSDCTCASSGAILGIILGAKNIPAKWKDPVGDEFKYLVRLKRDNRISKLAEETCQIGLIVAQKLNREVVIADIPMGLELPSPTNKQKECLSLEVDYCGEPVIGYGTPKRVTIRVKNEAGEKINGNLSLDIPEGWEIDRKNYPLTLLPSDSQQIEFVLSRPKSLEQLRAANELRAAFYQDGKVLREEVFGLAGTNIWLVLGPFWQALSESKLVPSSYPPHQGADLPPIECMLSNEAEIDYEFLPEPKIDRNTRPDLERGIVFERRVTQTAEDNLNLDSLFTIQGPAVVYLLRYIRCPEERKAWFMIGTNDAVKVWLDDQLVHASHDHYAANPFNHNAEVELKEGINKILVKVARCGNQFDFRFGIKNHTGNHWHQEHWMTDLTEALC